MRFNSEGVVERTSNTWAEIVQQPDVWPTTQALVAQARVRLALPALLSKPRILLTGAGTSAYASAAIASAWPGAVAVPSTDLLVDTSRFIAHTDLVISIGRSGNSPESIATVERIDRQRPDLPQLAITCNPDGWLARSPLVGSIVLDPRTDDKSLVMTSSFSNLVLAGYCLVQPAAIQNILSEVVTKSSEQFDDINSAALRVANAVEDRMVFLCSSPLFPWAQESALKVLEMTAGRYAVLPETYLGLRHGPMSFLKRDTVVVCLLSNSAIRRRYELDLVEELKRKGLGHVVSIGATADEAPLFADHIPANAPNLPDDLRTPFEILSSQLVGYHLSLRNGLNPDNPSLTGVINRVVSGVNIYDYPEN